MKHFKNNTEHLVILSNEEYEIINSALNNRMVHLGDEMNKPNNRWATNEWKKCLDLQIEWFDLINK